MYSLLVCLMLLVTETPGTSVTATRLDGASLVGEVKGWFDQQLVVATGNGIETVATDELISVRWPAPTASGNADGAATSTVEFVDGTVLPASDIRITGGQLSMMLAASAPTDYKPLTIPVKRVAAVRLATLKPAAREQWQEIRDGQRTTDMLLVSKRGGESLDYVEGVLGDVTADKIHFKFDDDELQIDRGKAIGFIFFRRDDATQPDARCVLHGHNGLRISASQVRLEDGSLHVQSVDGLELDVPLAEIEFADFSAGKIRYLSDIKESTTNWTPLVALPVDASQANTYGHPRRDRSAYGGPLTLSILDASAPGSTGRLQIFSKGLALRSRSEMVFRLPTGFGKFLAVAGIEPATSTTGNVQLSIYADDRPLFDATISGQQPPREIELEIAGVKRLKIVVDFGKNLDTGDWLNLCDARLVK